jgi:hypothetical protein
MGPQFHAVPPFVRVANREQLLGTFHFVQD